MYLEPIREGLLLGQRIRINYDCNGGFKRCGTESTPLYKVAKKNAEMNDGKHICHSCQLKANNPANKQEVQEKIKKTNLERYGTTCSMNTPEQIATRTEKMFGTQEAIDARTEKTKATNLKRFGVEFAGQSEELKQKGVETNRQRYGTDHPMQNEQVKRQARETIMDRFGVENILSYPEIRKQCAKTSLERYGVEHYNQLPEMREYLRENCKTWLAASYAAGGPAKGIKRPAEWNNKQRATVKERIMSGNWPGGFASNFKGRFPAWRCKKEKPRFLSILEAKFHLFLNNNPLVEWYDYEGLVIEYQKADGTSHDYYVDFQVKYIEDEIKHNYEVNAYKNRDKYDTQLKFDAAIDYCSRNNMTYTMLFESDIDKLGITYEVVKGTPGIELYVRK